MSNKRRSTRLANKKRVDYSEDDPPIIVDKNLEQIEIRSTKLNEKTVQPAEDVRDQTIINNDNSFDNEIRQEDSESSNKIVNLASTPLYVVNDENAPRKRRTKISRFKFQQASKT